MAWEHGTILNACWLPRKAPALPTQGVVWSVGAGRACLLLSAPSASKRVRLTARKFNCPSLLTEHAANERCNFALVGGRFGGERGVAPEQYRAIVGAQRSESVASPNQFRVQ